MTCSMMRHNCCLGTARSACACLFARPPELGLNLNLEGHSLRPVLGEAFRLEIQRK